MTSEARMSQTKVYLSKVDEAYARSDEAALMTALRRLANHVSKGDYLAAQFIWAHVVQRTHRYEGRNNATFSTWAFRVLKRRHIDWIRMQQSARKREAKFVRGKDTEDEKGDHVSAEENLGRLCVEEIPMPERFGKREIQKLRATKALNMRDAGSSNEEIAAVISLWKRPVKPSSIPAMLSRWRRAE